MWKFFLFRFLWTILLPRIWNHVERKSSSLNMFYKFVQNFVEFVSEIEQWWRHGCSSQLSASNANACRQYRWKDRPYCKITQIYWVIAKHSSLFFNLFYRRRWGFRLDYEESGKESGTSWRGIYTRNWQMKFFNDLQFKFDISNFWFFINTH